MLNVCFNLNILSGFWNKTDKNYEEISDLKSGNLRHPASLSWNHFTCTSSGWALRLTLASLGFWLHFNLTLGFCLLPKMRSTVASRSGTKGGKHVQPLKERQWDISRISIFMHFYSLSSASNPCLRMTCDFMCLLNPTGARCTCPEGKVLLNGTCADAMVSGRPFKVTFWFAFDGHLILNQGRMRIETWTTGQMKEALCDGDFLVVKASCADPPARMEAAV